MQGLHIAFILAAALTLSAPALAGGQPRVADVTAHRVGHEIPMVDSGSLHRHDFEISAPGATFLKVHFSEFVLPEGVVVEVSNPSGTERYRYSATGKDAHTFDPEIGDDGARSFSAMSVSGDRVRVRLLGDLRAIDPRRHALRIGHYMEGLPEPVTQSGEAGTSLDSTCGADEREDAVCWASSHPDAYDRARPVGKVVTTTGIVCTAWRVGPQNRIFTAEHCIASQSDVSAAEVWFNYQADICGGQNMESVTKVSGKSLLAVDETLDFALFTVNGFEKLAPFGYLGLDVRQGIQGEKIFIPQHGFGHPKQLAVASDMNTGGLCQIDDESHDGYGVGTDLGYYCDTVASSSGSPVVAAATGRVIALHHLGGCVNSGAKISLIWPMVAEHFGGAIPAGDTEPVLHNRPPSASISLACKGVNCSFSGLGSRDLDGSIVNYEWDFGDGRSASGARASHRYSGAGDYRVTLTVTDERGGRGVAERSVRIGNPPPQQPPPSIDPRG